MKKRVGKRLVSVLLCFSLLLTSSLCVGIPVSADVGDTLVYEVENNNTRPLANSLANDITVSGVAGGGDIDYFKIGVSSELTINIVLASYFSGLHISLDNGAKVLTTSQTYYMDGGYGTVVSWNATPGTYYIEIQDTKNTSYNEYMFYVFLAHVHVYEAASVVKPTCTSQGYTVYSCVCGDFYYDDYTETAEHVFSNSYDQFCDVCNAPRIEGWKLEDGRWVFYRNAKKRTNAWVRDSAGWRYLDADGYMLCNGWAADSQGWCYMNADGLMVKNKWVKHDGDWYFILSSGYMATNLWKKDSTGWCYLGADGRMVRNDWVADGNAWYYMDRDGYMLYNTWKKHGGKWYFLNSDGRMAANVWKKDSTGWCYLQADGSMATDKWVKDSVGWCYVGADGYCLTSCWKADSVGWCYLDANGRMLYNSWVKDETGWAYVGEQGYALAECWMKDSVGWCYLGANGRMVTDGWARDSHGWCYLGKSGYVTAHPNDGCDHEFSEATYQTPATCVWCGAKNGKVKPVSLSVEEPYYTLYYDYTLAKVYNISYHNDENQKLHITFDIQNMAEYRDGMNGRVGASFVLYDYTQTEIDRYDFVYDGVSENQSVYDKTVTLDIRSWAGIGTLYFAVEDME